MPLLPFSLSLHKLKPYLVEYVTVLVSFWDRIILSSKMSLMFTNDTIGSNYPCVQVWLGSQIYTQWVLVDLCSTFASGSGPVSIFLNWLFISDQCTSLNSIYEHQGCLEAKAVSLIVTLNFFSIIWHLYDTHIVLCKPCYCLHVIALPLNDKIALCGLSSIWNSSSNTTGQSCHWKQRQWSTCSLKNAICEPQLA